MQHKKRPAEAGHFYKQQIEIISGSKSTSQWI